MNRGVEQKELTSKNLVPTRWGLGAWFGNGQQWQSWIHIDDLIGVIDVAFLIVKNDSLWHEQYFDGYDVGSKSNSVSVIKTIVQGLRPTHQK